MIEIISSWKNSIFKRLLLTFLFVLIPVYFVGICIYSWGMSTVREEILNSMFSQVSFYLNGLETEIQRVKILQNDCLNDDDLNKLAITSEIMNNYEKSSSMLRLQQRLYAIKSSSIYINNVSVHIPSISKTISASGGIDDIHSNEFQMLNTSGLSLPSQITYINNTLYMNAMFPAKDLSGKGETMFLISIDFSNEELSKALKQFSNYEGSGTLLINLLENKIIANTPEVESYLQIKKLIMGKLNEAKSGKSSIMIGNKKYLVIYTTSRYLNVTLSKFIPEDQLFNPIKKYQNWLWLFSVVSAIIIAMFSASTYKFIHKPLQKLVKAFRRLENGDMSFAIQHTHNDEFGYLYSSFNVMLEKLNVLIDQAYKQKILVQHAELKQLQSQINPHFLYNSYFMLHRMVKAEDNVNAVYFSQQLGNYFKYITRNTADEVLLFMETDHARTYVEIQCIRYSKRINIQFEEVPEKYKDMLVPRLILQPVIENAIEHGLKDKEENGFVRIRFNAQEQGLCITVDDNGDSVTDEGIENLINILEKKENEVECTGIINIHRRIKLKFGSGSGLFISRSELGGIKVKISIVFEGEDYHV